MTESASRSRPSFWKGDGLLVPLDVDHGLENRGIEPLRIVLVFARPAGNAPG